MASPAGSADTLTTILNALRACLRATGDVRKAADKRLQDFEVVPTYCARLMDVVDATDRIDQPTRLLAVVCVHNTIHRHWVRRGRRYTIPDEEKADIRARLLAHMAEPDTRIARRLAIVLARVARTDWPRRWPELLDTLVAALRTGGVTTDRALYTLHRVVKEKSSQARGIGAKAFVQLATVVMPLVAQLWTSGCSALFSAAYVAAARVADVLVLTARRGSRMCRGPFIADHTQAAALVAAVDALATTSLHHVRMGAKVCPAAVHRGGGDCAAAPHRPRFASADPAATADVLRAPRAHCCRHVARRAQAARGAACAASSTGGGASSWGRRRRLHRRRQVRREASKGRGWSAGGEAVAVPYRPAGVPSPDVEALCSAAGRLQVSEALHGSARRRARVVTEVCGAAGAALSSPAFDAYAVLSIKFLSNVVECRSYHLSDARIAAIGSGESGKLNQVPRHRVLLHTPRWSPSVLRARVLPPTR